jgi:hypothetical protein
MSCCIGWWHPEAMALFKGLPCNDCRLEEEVPYLRAPGGLGDLTIRYGYQRFSTGIMIGVIIVLIALVAMVQLDGDPLARLFDHR